MVARPSRWATVDSVTNDDRAGAELAVDHLVGLGHRRIAHIDGGQGAGAASRRNGYAEAMRGGTAFPRWHGSPRGMFTEEGGAEGVDRLLQSGSVPTAIFASNDLAAVGALYALERHGLGVPADVSLVGYDNTSLAAMGT
jgi:DNA-binding LacI/PurR family transcriptional regulator